MSLISLRPEDIRLLVIFRQNTTQNPQKIGVTYRFRKHCHVRYRQFLVNVLPDIPEEPDLYKPMADKLSMAEII